MNTMDDVSKLSLIKSRFNELIWEREIHKLPYWHAAAIKTLRICFAVARDLADGQLSLRAMSLVYTTIISLVPLLALSFSVLKGFGFHNRIEPLLINALEPLGEKRFDITENIMGFVNNIRADVLGAVGFALLVYSAVAMMQKIENSFNYTWHINKGRTFSQRFSDYLSVITVGPLLLILSIGITSSLHSNDTVDWIATLPFMAKIIGIIGLSIPYFLMALAFAFIYFFMPNTKVNFFSAFIGGLLTAVIWKTMGIIFGAFVANSANHTAIYSAFASIIIFMVWIYLGWLILLVGASVAFYHQNPNSVLVRSAAFKLSHQAEEKMILTFAYLIAKNFQNNDKPWSKQALANHLSIPVDIANESLHKLEQVGFIVQSNHNPPDYYPAEPLESTKVYDIMHGVRAIGRSSAEKMHSEAPVEQYISQMHSAISHSIGNISFKDLIEKKHD